MQTSMGVRGKTAGNGKWDRGKIDHSAQDSVLDMKRTEAGFFFPSLLGWFVWLLNGFS